MVGFFQYKINNEAEIIQLYQQSIKKNPQRVSQLKKYYDEQNEQVEAQNNIMTNQNPSKTEIARPNIAPKSTYTTVTAPKK